MDGASEVVSRCSSLIELVRAQGDLTDERWCRPMVDVPRHLFVPALGWARTDGANDGRAIDRDAEPDTWWDAVYSDTSIVTQREDGAGDVTGDGLATCSCSAPGAVVSFLGLLDVDDHDRVLEIGTGTGWTAGLLSARIGDRNVTSVEIDPGLADGARANLKNAGYVPNVVVTDGAGGWPADVPYDRVHATCAVNRIPYAWVEQTRPGGVIVAPYAPGFGYGRLAVLHIGADGTATGRFPLPAGYMYLRSQRPARGAAFDWVRPGATPREAMTRLDPRPLAGGDPAADLFVSARVPEAQERIYHDEDTDSGEATFWVLDNSGRSWASVDYEPGRVEFAVRQYGARSLWDEVEAAYLRWLALGRPGVERFGITVTPDEQHVWLDDPARPVAVA